METLLNSFKDLLKFKLISSVNTGDKTQDSLITTFLFTLFTILCEYLNYYTMLGFWIKLRNMNDINNKYVQEYYAKIYDMKKYPEYALYVDLEKLFQYICKIKNLDVNIFDKTEKVYNKINKITGSTLLLIHIENNIPVYVQAGDTYISPTFKCPTMQILRDFLLKINSMQIVEKKSQLMTIQTYSNGRFDLSGFIYPDRTFDCYVSKYKKILLKSINNFENYNKNYNEFKNYNLGIIVHGEPGTGKTMLIKAIANKLQRHVLLIDMRTIKTKQQFEKIFEKRDEFIYCLDEFDCIQGVIKSREIEEDKNEDNKYTTNLKDRYLKILEIISKKDTNDNKHLEEELTKIKQELKEEEDKLSLDSILTVLDGPIEMRNRIIIATTNYINRIDSALLRNGRFDIKIKLEKFNEDETRELLCLMFKDKEERELINKSKFKEYIYTPVDLISLVNSLDTLENVLEKLC